MLPPVGSAPINRPRAATSLHASGNDHIPATYAAASSPIECPAIRPERRAQTLFGEDNPRHREHLEFFFDALDVWADASDIRATFEAFFTTSASTPGIRLFGAATVNLFRSCCERYGATRGSTRAYSLTDTLLLYATLIHRILSTAKLQSPVVAR